MRHRHSVEIAAGSGMTHDEIAIAFNLTTAELRAKYAKELSVGAHRRRIRVMISMFEEAKVGNVAAAKVYMANEVAMAAPPLAEAVKAAGRKPKKGLKEERNEVAKTAEEGTEWEGLLGPTPAPGSERTQ